MTDQRIEDVIAKAIAGAGTDVADPGSGRGTVYLRVSVRDAEALAKVVVAKLAEAGFEILPKDRG